MRSASRLLFTAAGVFWISAGTCGITSADNPPKADRELHVVGIYEGSTRTGDRGGYLYAYNPNTKVWPVLAEKISVSALAYHRMHDRLYGIAVHHSEDGGEPAIREFNSEGARLRETPLAEPVVPGSLSPGPGPSGTQLVTFDDYLIAIAAPFKIRSSEDIHSDKTYIYLIQPKTGKVQVTWKNPE